jgi:hypothetical protein
MTSRGKRNPAKLELGEGTRRWRRRRRISSTCLKLPSTNATPPLKDIPVAVLPLCPRNSGHAARENHSIRSLSGRAQKTITRFQTLILTAVEHPLSNARSEATNTHLRLLTRRAYGYHSPDSLIAMADLTHGGLCPPLPGRS